MYRIELPDYAVVAEQELPVEVGQRVVRDSTKVVGCEKNGGIVGEQAERRSVFGGAVRHIGSMRLPLGPLAWQLRDSWQVDDVDRHVQSAYQTGAPREMLCPPEQNSPKDRRLQVVPPLHGLLNKEGAKTRVTHRDAAATNVVELLQIL